MSREVPAPDVDGGLVQATPQTVITATEPFSHVTLSDVDRSLAGDLAADNGVLDRVSKLKAQAKVALIRQLMTQLEADHIQAILEFGLREIGGRHRRGISSENHNTRLLLKKDYSYQDRGLNEPTQYYVYLRRRKPKLDRYIGTLFYIPQGCALEYFLDVEGRLVFKPPHNVFQLQDSTNPAVNQVVRLLCLEPPPPEYTFDKQQSDTPDIRLQLEYLDLKTHQPIAKQSYLFPSCMHEGGRLDRYRWEVAPILLLPDAAVSHEPLDRLAPLNPSITEGLLAESPLRAELGDHSLPDDVAARLDEFNPAIANQASWANAKPAVNLSEPITAPIPRRVLELPQTRWLTFYLSNCCTLDTVLKRMRLWVAWSEKAMPQARWEIVQDGTTYTLMNAHFKRRILQLSSDRASVAFDHSLPVLMRWFHGLGLAVSQAQNQRPYSTAQLQLARSLFVDMSLPQADPLVVLKKLFGVEFSKTLPDRS